MALTWLPMFREVKATKLPGHSQEVSLKKEMVSRIKRDVEVSTVQLGQAETEDEGEEEEDEEETILVVSTMKPHK